MNTPKRLVLYALHDKNGCAGEYVTYCLKALRDISCRVIVITGSPLQEDGQKAIKALGAEIIAGGKFRIRFLLMAGGHCGHRFPGTFRL